jgi:hypothetical protein
MIIMRIMIIMIIMIIMTILAVTNKFRFLPEKMRKILFAPVARSKHDSASIENRGSPNADFSEIWVIIYTIFY